MLVFQKEIYLAKNIFGNHQSETIRAFNGLIEPVRVHYAPEVDLTSMEGRPFMGFLNASLTKGRHEF